MLTIHSLWPARPRCHCRSDGQRAPSRHTSAPRSIYAIRAAAFRDATDRLRGPTDITSSTGPTAVQPSSRTWSPCADRITVRCTKRDGASTLLIVLPWWSHLPDEGSHGSGGVSGDRPASRDVL